MATHISKFQCYTPYSQHWSLFMRYLIALLLLLSSEAHAGNGFFLGGVADGYNRSEDSYQQRLDRQFEAERQRRMIEENNDILTEQRNRQWQQDIDHIFGVKRR